MRRRIASLAIHATATVEAAGAPAGGLNKGLALVRKEQPGLVGHAKLQLLGASLFKFQVPSSIVSLYVLRRQVETSGSASRNPTSDSINWIFEL
jgi:hypothetical protein